MSRAESHEVGGGKAAKEEGGDGGGGLEDRVLNERGAGDGVGECLSLRTAMMEKARDNNNKNQGSLINYVTSARLPPNPLSLVSTAKPYSRLLFRFLIPYSPLVLFIPRRASLPSSSFFHILLFSVESPRWASFRSEYVNPL